MYRAAGCISLMLLPLLVACSASPDGAMGPRSQATQLATLDLADSQGARIYIDLAGSCGLFDGNGSVVFPLANQVTLITPSQNGNALATCFADVANPTGRAIRYDSENNPIGVPIPCFILDPAGPPIVTYFVFETISASGRASLLCVAKRLT